MEDNIITSGADASGDTSSTDNTDAGAVDNSTNSTAAEDTNTDTDAGDGEQEEQEEKPLEFDEDGNLIHEVEEEEEAPPPVDDSTNTGEDDTNTVEEKEPTFEDLLKDLPERELAEVEKIYEETIQAGVKEFTAMTDKFLAKAGKPIIMQVNPETGKEEAYYADYTAEEALQYGIQTGDYDAFLTALPPLQVKEFIKEKDALDSKYDATLESITKEKEAKAVYHAKQADLKEWDAYIKESCKDDPVTEYMLNKLKNESGFEKGKVEKFRTWLKEANALKEAKQNMTKQTQKAKKAMMGSTPIPANTGGNKVFTRESIKNMSDAEYEANEAEILKQARYWK